MEYFGRGKRGSIRAVRTLNVMNQTPTALHLQEQPHT